MRPIRPGRRPRRRTQRPRRVERETSVTETQPSFVEEWIDLAQPRLGAEVIFASDDFFAPKERLIKPEPPVFIPDKYDDHGKWMDGWETRRRREPGNDWTIIALGHPGEARRIEVDTAHFKGNFPESCLIQAAFVEDGTRQSLITQSLFWDTLLPRQTLAADTQHRFEAELEAIGAITHLRLNIIPDGGVSRLRLHGHIVC